jgi:hypothetical protein
LTRLPQARERARLRARERELEERREQAVDEHHEQAAGRARQAEIADQRARVAAQEAERERAEARVAEEKARLHERGLADDELIGDNERERFAGTSATEPPVDDRSTSGAATPGSADSARAGAVGSEPAEAGAGEDARDLDDRSQRERTTAYEEGRAAADDPARVADFEAGRQEAKRQ